MFDPGAEHGEVRLSRASFEFGKGVPRAVEQVIPPAFEELLLELGESAVFDRGLREAGIQRHSRPLAPVIVIDQVLDGPLHVIAETAPLGVAMAEVAPEKSERELLVQLRRGVRVFQGFEQVTVDGPGITAHQLSGRLARLVRRSGVGLKNHGPLRGHLTEPRLACDVFQGLSSSDERLPPVDDYVEVRVRVHPRNVHITRTAPSLAKSRLAKIVEERETRPIERRISEWNG